MTRSHQRSRGRPSRAARSAPRITSARHPTMPQPDARPRSRLQRTIDATEKGTRACCLPCRAGLSGRSASSRPPGLRQGVHRSRCTSVVRWSSSRKSSLRREGIPVSRLMLIQNASDSISPPAPPSMRTRISHHRVEVPEHQRRSRSMSRNSIGRIRSTMVRRTTPTGCVLSKPKACTWSWPMSWIPHPSKLELINTGHAAGYTVVHWSPKRSCDARKPRSTTTAAAKAPHRGWMTDGFVVDSPTGRTGHRRRFPRVGRCHRSPVIQHQS